MTTLRTIDVSVPHTLGVATAWDRVLRWLSSASTDGVKPLKTDINHYGHWIGLTLEVRGYVVRARIYVTDVLVELSSDPIDGAFFVVAAGTVFAEGKIHSQLTELLR